MRDSIYDYNNEKNLKLLRERGVGFEDVISVLNTKGFIAALDHPNPTKYPDQKIYVVEINSYAYLVPFEKRGDTVVLKTIYPSRKINRLYREKFVEGRHE